MNGSLRERKRERSDKEFYMEIGETETGRCNTIKSESY